MQQLVSATPVLRVSNIGTAVRYFTERLGFLSHGVYPAGDEDHAFYAYLSRDGVNVHLERGTQISGGAVYFVVRDVDLIHAEFRSAGADVLYDPDQPVQGPGDQPWGMREIWVRDLDGNVLRFGQPLRREDADSTPTKVG